MDYLFLVCCYAFFAFSTILVNMFVDTGLFVYAVVIIVLCLAGALFVVIPQRSIYTEELCSFIVSCVLDISFGVIAFDIFVFRNPSTWRYLETLTPIQVVVLVVFLLAFLGVATLFRYRLFLVVRHNTEDWKRTGHFFVTTQTKGEHQFNNVDTSNLGETRVTIPVDITHEFSNKMQSKSHYEELNTEAIDLNGIGGANIKEIRYTDDDGDDDGGGGGDTEEEEVGGFDSKRY